MPSRLLPLVALVAVTGCVPLVPVRRSALVPAVGPPARVGAALARGQSRVQARLGALRSNVLLQVDYPPVPSVGDPGLFLPDFEIGGSAYFGVGRGLELGLQGAWSALGWATPNAQGVLPFPSGEAALSLRGGGGLRYDAPLGPEPLRLSLLAQLDLASVPEAVFVLQDDGSYAFDHMDSGTFLLPNVGVSLGWEAAPWRGVQVTPYLVAGAQRSVTNVGFDANADSVGDSTLSGYWLGYVGLGADVHVHRLVVGTTVNLPFAELPLVDFGPSVTLTLGVTTG